MERLPALTPPRPVPWLQSAPDARVWRWRLARDGPLPVERTVDVAQAIWAALNETARAVFGDDTLSPGR
jgi:hypothetical protein